jgi:eukaryotic-like serine/threonine-protein kinase
MPVDRFCTQCGKPLSGDVASAKCPSCLLRHGPDPKSTMGANVSYGFEPTNVGKVLETLALSLGTIPSVLLPQTREEEADVTLVRSSSEEMPGPANRGDRYQLFGEIARGGMGAILKGRDSDLGRDLAFKVLLEDHQSQPNLVRRFVEEAQIGGQLQHPGIVPVYELGSFTDQRPYFTMKLVKGRTLAALLADRGRTGQDLAGSSANQPDLDLPHFLSIFESIALTVAYAHARGVIHRDLKPANIMVGNFGEVQVMDWGLAKVLREGGLADERTTDPEPAQISLIQTVRTGSTVDDSQDGSVMGTPAYMAPEQAGGDIEQVDRRADVFGLGSILCEILTGRPAYTGRAAMGVLRKAARGDLADAHGRLDDVGRGSIDGELISLAKDCLAAERDDRPRDASVVADRVRSHLAGIQTRLRAAELARAAEAARAEEALRTAAEADARALAERRSRRLTMALAASVVALITLGGGGFAWLEHHRARQFSATVIAVNDALGKADRLRVEALADPSDQPVQWGEALAEGRRASDLIRQSDVGPALRQRVSTTLAQLEKERDGARARAERIAADRRLLARLEAIRGERGEHFDLTRNNAAYAAAFRDAGLDVNQLDPKAVGAGIADRSAPVEFAAYLDDWAGVRLLLKTKGANSAWQPLIAAARVADPDRWRDELRSKLETGDSAALQKLADDTTSLKSQTGTSLVLLAKQLQLRANDPDRAEKVLREAWKRFPGDFWTSYELAHVRSVNGVAPREMFPEPEVGVRFLTAALAARPASAAAHSGLGNALLAQRKFTEAEEEFRSAVTLMPDSVPYRVNLANALYAQRKPIEAEVQARKALALDPKVSEAHNALGSALYDQRQYAKAETEFRAGLDLQPKNATARANLANALNLQGKPAEAEIEARKALALKPELAEAHANLATALVMQGQLREAEVEARAALLRAPNLVEVHNTLGSALWSLGKIEDAAVEFRTVLRFMPNYAEAHNNLGVLLADLGKLAEAETELMTAVRLKPTNPGTYFVLGTVRIRRGDPDGALIALRRARDQKKPGTPESAPLATLIGRAESQSALLPRLTAILQDKERLVDNGERLAFAELCYNRSLFAASARFYSEALSSDPKLSDNPRAGHRYNAACAAVKAASGQGKDDPVPDDDTKAELRRHALTWLNADLSAWKRISMTIAPGSKELVAKTITHWKTDPDLAGIRDDATLAPLPQAERSALKQLWNEVEKVLTELEGRG